MIEQPMRDWAQDVLVDYQIEQSELLNTEDYHMKSITTSYWIPLQVGFRVPQVERKLGMSGTQIPYVENFMSKVINSMTYKYGNIAGAYYVIEGYDYHPEDAVSSEVTNTTLHIEVVFTSIVAGGAHAEDMATDALPTDLADTFREEWDNEHPEPLSGYDLNPIREGPNLNVDNGW